ncbi:MAG: TonB-dependent receptor [Burkholderiaceae bacterium]|nr:TonB-dependent receptor [Burkholderiaceae bacterium]MCD8564936.1 TonB-dependent receptor [Burkholderiaceae bacterium]
MYFHTFRRTAIAVACVICTPAFAQNSINSPTELDPIIVTATRSPEPLEATIGDNSVVTREILDQTPDSSLAEVLSRQHGITYIDRGGPQSVSAINVRGTNSKQSLVLIDGMRINSPTNGLPILNAIPLNAIERIEIVRGAASSIYGADAIGGVINVITRQAGDRPLQFEANVGVGSYATSLYNASLSGSQNGWTYSLFGGYEQSNGLNASNGDDQFAFTPDNDSYYDSDFGGQLGYTWANGQTLSIQTFQSRVNGGFDTTDLSFNDRSIQTLGNTIVTSRNQINERWLSTLSASFMTEKNETVFNPSWAADGYFRSKQQQYQWLNRFELTDTQSLTVGYERLNQSVDASSITLDNDSLFTNSLMAIYTGQWGIHQVQASIRNDNNSQYGNFTTGSLGYAIDITKEWRANISANTGFRAPTFIDLYYPGGFGNPDLQPERSRNLELGLNYRHRKGEIGLVGFYNKITDLIVPGRPTKNVDTAVIKGLTLTATQQIGQNTVITASYDLLSPYNTTDDEILPFNAQRVLRLSGTHEMGEFSINADWYLTSSRKDGDGTTTLGGYGLFNLGASYSVNKHLQFQVQWNNVFDKNYTLVKGYNTPGSNVFFNVKATY